MKCININDIIKDIYTSSEVAHMLNVSSKTINNYCNSKKIKCFLTPGNQRRIKKEDLIEYLQQHDLLLGVETDISRHDIIYARTNTSKQQLIRQVEKICRKVVFLKPINVLILQELKDSDSNLAEFQKLITLIVQDKVRNIFILRNEIFDKAELILIRNLCKQFNSTLINVSE